MIELNLLPDVKLKLVKAQRIQRIIIVVSILASAGAIALVVTLFSLNQIQKKHISDLNSNIAKNTTKLKNDSQLKKILTVQNQVNSLTALHAQKPAASRLFGYLNQVTPSDVGINSFTIDFNAHTATITGTAPALSSVNKYVDTLKFTDYQILNTQDKKKAFSNVVLSSFAIDSKASNPAQAATYTISFSYEPVIFDISKEITLIVPKQTTTRSTTEQPTELFQAAPKRGTN